MTKKKAGEIENQYVFPCNSKTILFIIYDVKTNLINVIQSIKVSWRTGSILYFIAFTLFVLTKFYIYAHAKISLDPAKFPECTYQRK